MTPKMTETLSLRFQRPNYLVADIDRALTLYRDVLGFEIGFISGDKSGSYSYEVFEIDPAAGMRMAALSTASQRNVMALTEITKIDLPAPPMPRRAAIVLECPHFDDVVAGAKKLNLKCYEEAPLRTKDGREGRELGLVDFDGNLIVIYTITKDNK